MSSSKGTQQLFHTRLLDLLLLTQDLEEDLPEQVVDNLLVLVHPSLRHAVLLYEQREDAFGGDASQVSVGCGEYQSDLTSDIRDGGHDDDC